jgi:nitrate/TMAO reductase-like tetraheme cytochrome c subunit
MTPRERLAAWVRPVFYLGNNGITLAGAALTTASGITLVLFWINEVTSTRPPHPYAGIVLFLVLPAIFVLGLVLMPAGALAFRRRLRREGRLTAVYPRVDFHEPLLRRAAVLVAGATVVNVALIGTASYKGVEYMDSNQFCGLTCHTVMAPEHTAFLNSPHSRVGCVQCHIGPGAPWFVRSKLSGVRQVFAVAFETYSRPIPSPVHELRPARETCEQCHWPQKFHGDKFLVRTSYGDDEKNTPATTVLILKIGGRTWQGSVGIHGRHLDDVERISYVSTDARRQVIPRVTYLDDDGKLVEFASDEVKVSPADLTRAEHRKMDCVDCHNRPTHAFEVPERAVDRAIDEGRISRELPYVRKKAVEALKAEYPDRARAGQQIPAALAEFYRTSYPDVYRQHRALVENASAAVTAIYMRNVFPEMKVTWGVHPNHIGHEDFLGCFRCHDEKHRSADGRTISQDCDACHTILAMQETNPKVLAELGLRQ